eukprot:3125052-Rhodomonas_salina.2
MARSQRGVLSAQANGHELVEGALRPLSTTGILSALRMVERRCAIRIVVPCCFCSSSSSPACTTRSLSLSSAHVASSSSSTDGC